MSLLLSRNVIIPVWFVLFALFTAFGPPLRFLPPIFLLIVGLAVPTVVYVLCKEAPIRVSQAEDTTKKG